MYISTATITSKGQVLLPKKVRDIIRSNIVSIEINDNNQILLSPVQNLAGSLSEFAKKGNKGDVNFDEIREESWKDNTKHLFKPE